MVYVLLIIGFVLLTKGADFFVDGSSSIARLFKIPAVIVGLTIVAMGTSAPEAAVSITAGLSGNNDIAIANVIGSNIFNLLIVVGLCVAISDVKIDSMLLKRDFPVNIGISVLLLLFLIDLEISRVEGIILLVIFIYYIFSVVRNGLKNRDMNQEEENLLSPMKSILYIIIGIGAIIWGGDLVVDSASTIASNFGLSQNLIGLTIVALGTSLPELVTSIVAVKKGESGLALGNAVGSCVFNILFVLGISVTISPIQVISDSFVDGVVLLGVTILMLFIGKKPSRWKGFLCIAFYAAYMVFAIMR